MPPIVTGVMTTDHLEALRAVPAGLIPNRLPIAIAFARVTQTAVCEATEISNARMSAIVNGKRPAVTVDEAAKIARFFECRIEDIFPLAEEAVA